MQKKTRTEMTRTSASSEVALVLLLYVYFFRALKTTSAPLLPDQKETPRHGPETRGEEEAVLRRRAVPKTFSTGSIDGCRPA